MQYYNRLVRTLVVSTLFFISWSCSKSDVTQLDYKSLGSSAKDFLVESTYTALNIEIAYMPGYQPDATALQNLTSFLAARLNKSGGITINTRQIATDNVNTYTLQNLVASEKKNRTLFTGGQTLTTFILVTDSSYSVAPTALGVSYWNTSMAFFGAKINKASGGIGQMSRTNLWTTVLEHEFCHLMGLVNAGTPMVTAHGSDSHCNNTSCLMNSTVQTTGGNSISAYPSLDANCLADLKANGGK